MKTYSFQVVAEPDEDIWSACCPSLLRQGAATWADTKEEALENIQDVVNMVVESLIEHGETIPEKPASAAQIAHEAQLSDEVQVTV